MLDLRKRSLAALLLPVVVLALGCCGGCLFSSGGDDDDGDPPDGDDVVWPLDLNNSWTYEYSAGAPPDTFTIQVTGTEDVDGTTVSKVEYVDYVVPGYYVLVRNATGGLYFYGDEIFGELTDPDLWVKYPCSAGDTWQTSGQGATVDWQVIATAENVTVPDGTYSCIHIRGTVARTGRTFADHWYCVGTGWIKMTNGPILIELIDKDI